MADVADQILLNLIDTVATQHNFVNYNVKVQPVSSGGANFTSKLFGITVTEIGNSDLELFAKVASLGNNRPPALAKIYDVEHTAYTKLAGIYQKLEVKNKVPPVNKLGLPKFYGCHPNKYSEVLIIENLSCTGFSVYERVKSIDWRFAARAVEELAKLHALSFAFEAEHPKEFSELVQNLKRDTTDNEQTNHYWNHVVNTAINATKIENREALKIFLDQGKVEVMTRHFSPLHKTVIIHSDYRVSNLMRKMHNDGSIEIKIVDLQTLQGGSPIVDLLYFIFTGSDEQFRAEYYSRLVEHYYVELCAALSRFQLKPDEIYSRDQFYAELEEKLPFGLSIAIFSLPVITVEAENAPKVDEITEASSFSIEKTSDLYTERLNGIVNDYVKWGILK